LPAPFGRYRLLKLLGEGGMGRVYLAHDSQLDRPVALKVPLFGPDDAPALLERFYREARAAATVLHANVCPVYDVGQVDGVPYLTMAFIEGRPLGQFAAQRPLTPKQATFLVRKLALALAEAHKRGVIHRDLKPANVMVNRQGEPVVMDIGLARRARGGDARLTRQGAFLGTPAYAPPEQVSGEADNMGPACDVYSLGVILYELLAGRLPFEGDALLVISRVLLEEPPPPSQFRPDLDPELEAICLKAMAKKPEQRYASMAVFAGALQEYLRGKAPAGAAAPAPVPATDVIVLEAPADTGGPLSGKRLRGGPPARKPAPPTEALPPRPRRRRRRQSGVPVWAWVAGGAGLALVLLLVLGVVVYRLVSYGTVRFDPGEAGASAELRVDGEVRPWGKALRLRTGEHRLEASAPGYKTLRETFAVHRGDNPVRHVRLTREQAVAAQGPVRAEPARPEPARPEPARPETKPSELNVGEVRTTKWEGGPRIFSTAFSLDGRYYLAAGDKDTVRVWDVRSGEQVGKDIVGGYLAAFTPAGEVLTGAWDGSKFFLYEAATGRFLRGFGDGGELHNFTLSPDGNHLLTVNPDGIRLWDVKAGTPRLWYRCDPKTSFGLFAPGDRHFLLRPDGKPAWIVYDVGRAEAVPSPTPITQVTHLRGFLPAAQTFVLARGSVPGGRGAGRFVPAAQAYAVESTATHDIVQTYDVATGNKLRYARWERPGLDTLAWTADGRRMLVALKSHQVLVYDMAAQPEPKLLLPALAEKEIKRVLRGAISLSPDGRYACWGGDPGVVKLWRLPP
jgi:hypothetical protein